MALEAMPNYNDLFNYMVFDAQNASHYDECYFGTMNNVSLLEKPLTVDNLSISRSPVLPQGEFSSRRCINRRGNVGVQGRKKRRRRPKVCKNQEEAETQRMTHIAVERNRRKQMNEHLAVLRSLMPESYSQRGDQASIVGGAIEFVKELEQLVHSLEAQKRLILQPADIMRLGIQDNQTTTPAARLMTSGFPDVFSDPDPLFTQHGNKFTSKSRTAAGDVEVTLIETHANLRILSKKKPRQLSKLVSGFHSLCLAILHLNVTSLDPLILYSISVKVEECCQLTSVDSISQAVHQMLRIIEEDVSSYLTY